MRNRNDKTENSRGCYCLRDTLLSDIQQDEENGKDDLRVADVALKVLHERRDGLRVANAHSVLPVFGKLGQRLGNGKRAEVKQTFARINEKEEKP